MTIDRRTFVRGLAVAGVSLTYAGTVGASDATQFVLTGGDGIRRRVGDAGFDVRASIADDRVVLVTAPTAKRDELEAIQGVQAVSRNYSLTLSEPPSHDESDGDAEEFTPDREPFADLQWDKQVTDTAAANELSTGENATVAVIDTGIDYDHPGLEPNIDGDAGRLFREGEVYDGFDRPVARPVDPLEPNEGVETEEGVHVADDRQYHGSHVAGIAAAPANDVGIVGTAPDADLVSLRVFYWREATPAEADEDDDLEVGEAILATTVFDVLAAIEYAGAIGADAANLSLGSPEPLLPQENASGIRAAEEQVIQWAKRNGTVVVAAAGNAAANLQQGGRFTLPNSTAGALSVSSTAPDDTLAEYSNYGTNDIDVGAPGGGIEGTDDWPVPTSLILSTVPPEWPLESELFPEAGYEYLAGTSMAAPQVAGLVALVRDLEPDANPNQVESVIKAGAETTRGQSDAELGAGRLNAAKTVDRLE